MSRPSAPADPPREPMGSSLSADLVGGLSAGLSEEDAKKLWQQCDKKGTGVLNRAEAKQLVQLLADESSERLRERLDKLKEARSDPAQVDAFLSAFDISGDGKVEKDEFVKKAMEGYNIPLDLDEEEEEEAEEKEAAAAAPKRAPSEKFFDCEEPAEPPAKKARLGEKAPAEAAGSAGAKGPFKPGQKVKIVNVTTPAGKAFNGITGVIVSWNEKRGRWMVRMPQIVVPTAVDNLEAAAK